MRLLFSSDSAHGRFWLSPTGLLLARPALHRQCRVWRKLLRSDRGVAPCSAGVAPGRGRLRKTDGLTVRAGNDEEHGDVHCEHDQPRGPTHPAPIGHRELKREFRLPTVLHIQGPAGTITASRGVGCVRRQWVASSPALTPAGLFCQRVCEPGVGPTESGQHLQCSQGFGIRIWRICGRQRFRRISNGYLRVAGKDVSDGKAEGSDTRRAYRNDNELGVARWHDLGTIPTRRIE